MTFRYRKKCGVTICTSPQNIGKGTNLFSNRSSVFREKAAACFLSVTVQYNQTFFVILHSLFRFSLLAMNPTYNKTAAEDEAMVQNEFQALLADYAATSHKQKVALITSAFEFAKQAHAGTRRRSGEPYIMHPLAVARIVVREMGLGSTSICSALLHDVVEDTDYTTDDIRDHFGEKIAMIVEGLTKISGGIFGDKASAQAENFHKLILTIPEDVRVILVKMADRLHNMRTLGSMPPEKQLKITGETLYIYAPLAQRLGFFQIKTELENLCFKYEYPQQYALISKQIEDMTPALNQTYEKFIEPIERQLKAYKFDYKITYRIKTPYSVYKKIQKLGVNIEQGFDYVFDLLAVRIVVTPHENENEVSNCMVIQGIVTSTYRAHPDRTRDWISTPKTNGYEALHVTVMGPDGHWIEVQIRSARMNDIAEHGVAAHWKYKTGIHDQSSDLDDWFKCIKESLDKANYTDAIDFMNMFKLNLYTTEIYVFTPKGDIVKLPQKSTALDFAFYLHSDIGAHCIGAKVDHKLQPMSYELKSGDQVEILTSKTQQPQMSWLDMAHTQRATTALKSLLRKQIAVYQREGKHAIEERLEKMHLKLSQDVVNTLLEYYKMNSLNDLYTAAGRNTIQLEDIENVIFKQESQSRWVKIWKLQFLRGNDKKDKKTPQQKTGDTVFLTDESIDRDYKLADCCNPIPGDEVLGYLDEAGHIIVHKRDCPQAQVLKASHGDRIMTAKWETRRVKSFPATFAISGIDKAGLLVKIILTITKDSGMEIASVNFNTDNGIFNGLFTVYLHAREDANNLCYKLLKLKNVSHVHCTT